MTCRVRVGAFLPASVAVLSCQDTHQSYPRAPFGFSFQEACKGSRALSEGETVSALMDSHSSALCEELSSQGSQSTEDLIAVICYC